MPSLLNALTPEQLAAYRERGLAERHLSSCLWCSKEFPARPDQRFCQAKCRSAYNQAAPRILLDQLVAERERWQKERAELIHEIAELRRELGTKKAPEGA